MTPHLRKLVLTVHVVASVGWLGAVATFFALAIVGLTHSDEDVVRAVYITMNAVGRFVLLPLAVASLVSGIAQSALTPWGLFRHYWVTFKLLINLAAAVLLVLYLETLESFDAAARDPQSTLDELQSASPLLHATLALLLLDVATVLAVFKPRGLTPYGRRKALEARAAAGRT